MSGGRTARRKAGFDSRLGEGALMSVASQRVTGGSWDASNPSCSGPVTAAHVVEWAAIARVRTGKAPSPTQPGHGTIRYRTSRAGKAVRARRFAQGHRPWAGGSA